MSGIADILLLALLAACAPDQTDALPLQRVIDRVQIQVRQQRADDAALWRAALPRLQAPVGHLHLGPQPPLEVEQNPVVLGVVTNRSHHEVPIDRVEERFDVEINDPVITPATLTRLADGLVTETDAENRDLTGKCLDGID